MNKKFDNYKTLHALAECALEYLAKTDSPVKRYLLDDHLSDVIKLMIGEDQYNAQELKCIGVAHDAVKSMLKDALVEETGSLISITRKGKLVLGLTYPAYAVMKNWTAIDYIITKSSRFTTSAVVLLLLPIILAAIVVLKLSGQAQSVSELLCKLLQGLLK